MECVHGDGFTLYTGDVLEVLSRFEGNSFDGCLCDPPYLLEFMGKAFDKQHKSLEGVNDGERMYRWHLEWCKKVYRVLKPGAFVMAFGGTRTAHRLACALEDTGFEIRDTIEWLYGSGFPKSLDISKQIDLRGGNPQLTKRIGNAIKAARESRGLTAKYCDDHFCGGTTNWSWFEGRPKGQRPPTPETFSRISSEWPELEYLSSMVREVEREIIGQSLHKPGIANKTVGHYTVGGTEVKHVNITKPATSNASLWSGYGTALKPAHEPVILAMKPCTGTFAENALEYGVSGLNIDGGRIGQDGGGTHCNNRDADGRCLGHRNAGRSTSGETFHGPESLGGRWPANLILSHQSSCNGVESGSCHSLCPIRFLDEQSKDSSPSRFFYQPKVSTRERNFGDVNCNHPTLKPVDLCRYLATLLLPPERSTLSPLRSLLIPFSGAGSEIAGAIIAGWDHVTGIEQDKEYVSWAISRIPPLVSEKSMKKDNRNGSHRPVVHSSLSPFVNSTPPDFPQADRRIGVLARLGRHPSLNRTMVEVEWEAPSFVSTCRGEYVEVAKADGFVRKRLLETSQRCREIAEELFSHAERLEERAMAEEVLEGMDGVDLGGIEGGVDRDKVDGSKIGDEGAEEEIRQEARTVRRSVKTTKEIDWDEL